MRGRLIVLAATMVLAGCATSGQTGSEFLSLRPKAGTARLVIYRTSPLGLLIQPDYFVDGRKAGSSQPGGFVVCDLAPGRHAVSVGNVPFALPLSNDPDAVTVTLGVGTTTFLRGEPRMGVVLGSIGLLQVAESQGRSDTASLYRIESDCRGS
jgi:hypothetical protein